MFDFSGFKTNAPRRMRVLQADTEGLHLSDETSGKVFVVEHMHAIDLGCEVFTLSTREPRKEGGKDRYTVILRNSDLGVLLYLLGYKTKGKRK